MSAEPYSPEEIDAFEDPNEANRAVRQSLSGATATDLAIQAGLNARVARQTDKAEAKVVLDEASEATKATDRSEVNRWLSSIHPTTPGDPDDPQADAAAGNPGARKPGIAQNDREYTNQVLSEQFARAIRNKRRKNLYGEE